MKNYRFSLSPLEAEAMWDFARTNEVNFHYVRQTELPHNEDPLTAAINRRYIYEGYMNEETYLMFRLIVPARDI